MHAIPLYSIIGAIRVMASHLGVVYGSVGTINSACDCVHGVLVNVRCSDGVGGRYMCTVHSSPGEID